MNDTCEGMKFTHLT